MIPLFLACSDAPDTPVAGPPRDPVETPGVTLLYTGNLVGEIEPCG